MPVPAFMSREHVQQMNRLLEESSEVAAACRALERDYVVAYELSDGPDGAVFWVMRFDRRTGVKFSLAPPQDADVTYVGDWAEAIQAGRAAREGRSFEPSMQLRGDTSVLATVADAYAAAQQAATVPVQFPDVGPSVAEPKGAPQP